MMLPEWTEKSEKRGLDPLGMQNSGVQLYQQLLPGISNVTLRMRYYGLYCWASEVYARLNGSTAEAEWRRWIRRLEALYALVAYEVGGETGVAGIDWAQRRSALGEPIIDFSDAASNDKDKERYLLQRLGVFGGAYLSQMVEMGLFTTARNHGLPTRSEPLGRAAGRAFGEAIGPDTERLLIDTISSARVSRAQLRALAPMVPGAIVSNSPEQHLYLGVLLARGEDSSPGDLSRRDTLLLLLDGARASGRKPSADALRWHLFSPRPALPDRLAAQRLRWEAYQAHDLFQIAAASLLRWAIDLVAEFDEGRSLPEIRVEAEARLIASGPAPSKLRWADFRDGLEAADDEIADWTKALVGRRRTAEQKIWETLSLIGTLDRRVRDRPDLAAEIGRSFHPGGGGRSIRSELRWLAEHEETPVSSLVAHYLVERIVRRHSHVAMQKFRRQSDYTFLLESRDGRLSWRAAYDPVATTPRLDPAIQFLTDVKLLDKNGITALGLDMLGTAA